MSMPDDIGREPLDTDLFVRVPARVKADMDAAAAGLGLPKAAMYRLVIKAGMAHLGITSPEPDQDPGAPPATLATVLHLRRPAD